jgi:hypothetical protein
MGAFSRLSSSADRKPSGDGSNGIDAAGSGADGNRMAARADTGIGARVQDVLDSANRAAHEIRAEAEGEGERTLADARQAADTERDARIRELLELRASLSVRAQEVERQAGELLNALTAAIDNLSGLDREGGLVLSQLRARRPSPEPVAYPGSGSRGRPFRPRT